jgi:RimJ/RimL family protein N-acetyltransferase
LVRLDPSAHGDDLYELCHGRASEDIWLYLPEGPFSSRESFGEYLERRAATREEVYFTILDNDSARAVGCAAYMNIVPAARRIEVGHVLFAPNLQRTTGATEAMYLMARHAFEDLLYRRYEWKSHSLNQQSRNAALRLGFVFEGIFRQHVIVKGRNRDTAWYSMLDSEWPARRAALEAWLDPANFDASGRQRHRLAHYSRAI